MSDHDECALTDHGCEHQCVNTHGTYMCVCDWGYRLDLDMRGCSGTYAWKFYFKIDKLMPTYRY